MTVEQRKKRTNWGIIFGFYKGANTMSRLLEDFIRLWKQSRSVADKDKLRLTVPELAQIWICTERNVKFVLNKMSDTGWIRYAPGRGRGHVSELTLLADPAHVILQEAQQMVIEGQVESALALINETEEDFPVKTHFLHWLSNYFGIRVEAAGGEHREVLRTPVFRAINTLDPASAIYSFDFHIIRQLYDTLVEYNHRTGAFTGSLAHHWSCNESATHWTFYLRKGVYFHNGKLLDAHDVCQSFQRLKHGGFAQSWLMAGVESFQAISENIVQIDLAESNYGFLHFLSFTPAAVIPKQYMKDSEDYLPAGIGTGPFQLSKYDRRICVLDAYDRHFRGRPYLDRVEIRHIPELGEHLPLRMDSSMLLVHTEEAGTESYVTDSDHEQIDDGYEGRSLLTINMRKKGPLQDTLFRMALSHLIDRAKMVSDLGELRVSPAQGLQMSANILEQNPVFDPDRGRELLRQSAYGGESLTVYCVERHGRDAYWLQQSFKQFDIHVDVKLLEWSELLTLEAIEEADFILFELELSEGPMRVMEMLRSESSFLRTHLSTKLAESVDEIIALEWAKPIRQDWLETFNSVESALLEECCMIFLTRKKSNASFHSAWQGVHMNTRGWVDFKDIWWTG
jgi:SgrR family transcriptional regulator